MKIARRKLFLFCILFSLQLNLKAQSWQWATSAGGINNDNASALTTDHSGNGLMAGIFFDTISFGATTLISPGLWSIFIAKYNPNGNLLWAKSAASDSAIDVRDISVDASGNILLVGEYSDTATFGSSLQSLVSNGDYDVFVAKYNSNGDFQWAKSLGGTGIDNAGGVSSDGNGNIFLTGEFHITPFPFSSSKIFVSKFDSLGNTTWLRTEINYGYSHFGNGIKTDANGNSYVTGEFFNTLIFDSLSIIDAGNVESNLFIAKFDSAGHIVWGQKAGAPSGYAGCKAIDVDANGNSFITGFYHGTIFFGPLTITSTSGLAYDVFIAKCDGSGNFIWVNKSVGPGNSKAISLDNSGNCYVCGSYGPTISFGTYTLQSAGSNDIFITKTDSLGNFNWATSFGGAMDENSAKIKTESNELLVTGNFLDTIHFGPSLTLTNTSNTTTDIFLAKLGMLNNVNESPSLISGLNLYPDPCKSFMHAEFEIHTTEKIQIAVTDISGKEVVLMSNHSLNAGRQNILLNTTQLKAGVYVLKIMTSDKTRSMGLFIKQ